MKLFLSHPLHAKLYLHFRPDPINPIVGYLGSSNLTFSGLSGQGDLNVDVLDLDATQKLANWFEERWNDRRCMDISAELADIIDQSWARSDLLCPITFTSRWRGTFRRMRTTDRIASNSPSNSTRNFSPFNAPPCWSPSAT